MPLQMQSVDSKPQPLTKPLIVVVDGFGCVALVLSYEPYGKFVGEVLNTMNRQWVAYQVDTDDPDIAVISVEAHLSKDEK